MRLSRGLRAVAILIFASLLAMPAFAQGNGNGNGNGNGKPDVVKGAWESAPSNARIIDVDLRDLPKAKPWKPGDAVKEIPRRKTRPEYKGPKPRDQRDPLLDIQESAFTTQVFNTPTLNYDGQGFTGVNPPDTVGDIGPVYYIQSINGSGGAVYTVYNKSDGSVAAGPFSMDSLGSGSCGSGLGDPIILWDELAQRWMISEFSSSGNFMCVYISQTSDPISGGWYNYGFQAPSFPDYPKYGVWSDAYYVGTNENQTALYAFDRAEMLNGNPATFQRFTVPDLSGFGFQMITPADHDGATAPPNGAAGIFMRHRDDEVHGGSTPGQDFLEMYELSLDWNNSSNSALTGPTNIAIAEIDSSLCGLTSFSCIPQPGTSTQLDPLREVVMNRLVYRNFGTYEVLVGNLATDVGGDRAGIRWFELRNTGSGWTLYQEGTYAPGSTDSRWMGSIAMDGSGNIALAYNIGSSSTFPGLRYTGRLAGDTLGTMTQGDNVIVNGSAANNSNRYGDYAAMGIDPVDDCTFWFTGQYNTAGQWSTRIASFSFETCGCEPTAAPTGLSATANGNNNIDLSWNAVAGATSYRVYRTTGSCPQADYTLIGVANSTSFSDTGVSGGTTYSYVVTGFIDAENCESEFSACADATATGSCTAAPSFAGASGVTNTQGSTCQLVVDWSAATSNCGGSVSYNVYRSTTAGFTPGPGNLEASCVAGLSYSDTNVSNGVTYYYVVRAEDGTSGNGGSCNDGNEDGNTVEVSGAPTGPNSTAFSDDFESGGGNFTTSAGPADTGTTAWAIVTSDSNSPVNSAFTSDEASIKDQYLNMASDVVITSGATLEFAHFYNTESTYDGGVVEVSTDGGSSWNDIGSAATAGGYNSTISTGFSSPIGGRQAWSGNSGGFITTTIDLSSLAGQSARFRWRLACDSSVAATGWWVDDITIVSGSACGGGGPVCTYSTSPASANYGESGGSGSVTVTTQTGCAWTATSNDAWITITSGAAGSGSGSVNYSVAANAGAARSGSLTVAGDTITITQDAASSGPTTIIDEDFENGNFGPFTDGGSDCRLSANDSNFANGTYAPRIRDNSGAASSFFVTGIDLNGFSSVTIDFSYSISSFEGSEDFFVEFFDGSNWVIVEDFVRNVDFANNSLNNVAPTITINNGGSTTFGSNNGFRWRCDASGNGDRAYIDDIVVVAQ